MLYVDGKRADAQAVDTANGSDSFGILAKVGRGAHTLKLEWVAFGKVLTSKSVRVTG